MNQHKRKQEAFAQHFRMRGRHDRIAEPRTSNATRKTADPRQARRIAHSSLVFSGCRRILDGNSLEMSVVVVGGRRGVLLWICKILKHTIRNWMTCKIPLQTGLWCDGVASVWVETTERYTELSHRAATTWVWVFGVFVVGRSVGSLFAG